MRDVDQESGRDLLPQTKPAPAGDDRSNPAGELCLSGLIRSPSAEHGLPYAEHGLLSAKPNYPWLDVQRSNGLMHAHHPQSGVKLPRHVERPFIQRIHCICNQIQPLETQPAIVKDPVMSAVVTLRTEGGSVCHQPCPHFIHELPSHLSMRFDDSRR